MSEETEKRDWWALLCVALGAIVLVLWSTTPPVPRGLDTPSGDFAAARAMVDVRVIARAASERQRRKYPRARLIGGGYMLALGYFLLQAVGPGMPFVAMLPLVLAAPLLWPVMPVIGRRAAWTASAVLLLAAMAIALWVRFDPIAGSAPSYSSDH